MKWLLFSTIVCCLLIGLFVAIRQLTSNEALLEQPSAPHATGQTFARGVDRSARPQLPPESEIGKNALLDALSECLKDDVVERRHEGFLDLLSNVQEPDVRVWLDFLDETEKTGRRVAFEKHALWRIRAVIDRDKALQDLSSLLSGVEPEDPRLTRATEIANEFLKHIPAAQARGWFDQLSDDAAGSNVRSEVFHTVALRLLDDDLRMAADWVRAQSEAPWRDNRAINAIADRYASQDPAGAANWIATIPPDPDNGDIRGVRAVVRRWAALDTKGLENWILSTRGTRLSAEAAGSYALLISSTNYELAKAWIDQIANYPEMRLYYEQRLNVAADKNRKR